MFDNLRNRKPKAIGENKYRKFAVMVCLVDIDGVTHVLFEKRAGSLRRQPGEICFPGGARDPEESSKENAVRETMEELLVSRDQIDVIAQMDTMYTLYDNKVSVYLCEIKDYKGTYNKSEVAEIFMVPLDYFLTNEPDEYKNTIEAHTPEDFPYDLIPGGREYHWFRGYQSVYFYNYAPDKIIWGLTAYIMRSVSRIIRYEAYNMM